TTMIGRIGGDEYALFIPYRLEEGVIARKMEQLCREMKLEEIAVQISYSAGICFSPDFGQCYETLYNNADIALLTSKRRGKNQYQIYKEGMDLPSGSLVETKETKLLDGASEAVFVSDAFTGEIIYINAPASEILCRSKEQCLGRKCHNLFWDREVSCDRCSCIEQHRQDYYEEDTLFGEEELPIHIKAKTGEWENREVRIHYIRVGK
ncbi:MAG: diguanylate cyclase, partial [Anaerovoracaceae bacterium]